MEPSQFDTLTRSLASGVSRRRALGRLGGGGAAALLAAAGWHRAAQAQAATTCTLTLAGNVRLGASAGMMLHGTTPGELRGTLSFALGNQGAIDGAQVQFGDGTTAPAVGQATGRAINLRLALGNNQTVILVGTAEQDLATCQGAVDGLLTGPQPGDLGDWHATASASGQSAGPVQTAAPMVTPVPAPGPSPTPQVTATATKTATTTPSAGATCAANMTTCNGVCTSLQTDPANCGGCGFVCPAGIGCVGAICCNPGTAPCTNDKYCCDGPCVSGKCQPVVAPTAIACASGLTACGGQCVNLNADLANCGTCGHACPSGIPCVGGSCTCPPALAVCNGKCTDTTSDAANCGSCGNVCAAGQTCKASLCS